MEKETKERPRHYEESFKLLYKGKLIKLNVKEVWIKELHDIKRLGRKRQDRN